MPGYAWEPADRPARVDRDDRGSSCSCFRVGVANVRFARS